LAILKAARLLDFIAFAIFNVSPNFLNHINSRDCAYQTSL